MTDRDETVRVANTRARSEGRAETYGAEALPGGAHRIVRRKVTPAPARPTPVVITAPPKTFRQKVSSSSRLGSPAALLLLIGLGLIYLALHGWDRKYGTFQGSFVGKANTPQGIATAAAAAAKPASTTTTTTHDTGQTG